MINRTKSRADVEECQWRYKASVSCHDNILLVQLPSNGKGDRLTGKSVWYLQILDEH